MKKTGFFLLLVWLIVRPTQAQEPLTLTYNSIIRMRAGAGYGAPVVLEIPPQSSLSLDGLSSNGQWARTSYDGQNGWVPVAALVSVPNLPTIQAAQWPLPTNNCISVVGDSIPYGSVVFKVPGHGFPVVRTAPLAVVLQEQLYARGFGYIAVHDRSVPAANLSLNGKAPYQYTEAFGALLQDRCRFIVMPAWNNELNLERNSSATAYAEDVGQFVELVHAADPDTHVLVLSHYWGDPQDFVEGYGVGVTYQNFQAHVEALMTACQPGGRLGQINNLSCLETQPIFAAMGISFVVLERSQQQLQEMLWEPIPPQSQSFFDVYWSQNPGAPVYGDGVHLSAVGKQAYIDAIISHLIAIDPNL